MQNICFKKYKIKLYNLLDRLLGFVTIYSVHNKVLLYERKQGLFERPWRQ